MAATNNQLEFDVVLSPQDDGSYTVTVPALPGCVSEGDSREEALSTVTEAIEVYLESLAAHGEPLPAMPVEFGRVTVAA